MARPMKCPQTGANCNTGAGAPELLIWLDNARSVSDCRVYQIETFFAVKLLVACSCAGDRGRCAPASMPSCPRLYEPLAAR